jgi:hypothetical protein
VYIGPDLEQSAIDAVQKWRFAPATKDGQPVEMPAQVEVNFRIPNKLAGELNTTIGERQIFAWKRMACKFSPSWILGWPAVHRRLG